MVVVAEKESSITAAPASPSKGTVLRYCDMISVPPPSPIPTLLLSVDAHACALAEAAEADRGSEK
jgi:hypothetical protein